MKTHAALGVGLLLVLLTLTAQGKAVMVNSSEVGTSPAFVGEETVVLGGGCFWCLEAVFTELKGVRSVESGYSGGTVAQPSYEEVCTGTTGHAEVVRIKFDPQIIPLHDLLSIFFTLHDPTTLNRQGSDVGTQYRSVIFYQNEGQKSVAQAVMKEIAAEKIWDQPLVTQLEPFQAFYRAEAYHQGYFENHPNQPYCRLVIEPKVRKLREKYKDRLVRPGV
jgi:peptide-methionine (S)-S-oxide reductase